MARPAGLEPASLGLEGRCAIRMSYGRRLQNRTRTAPRIAAMWRSLQCRAGAYKEVGAEGFEPTTSCSQSRRATRLRYTPLFRTNVVFTPNAREAGDDTHRPR